MRDGEKGRDGKCVGRQVFMFVAQCSGKWVDWKVESGLKMQT